MIQRHILRSEEINAHNITYSLIGATHVKILLESFSATYLTSNPLTFRTCWTQEPSKTNSKQTHPTEEQHPARLKSPRMLSIFKRGQLGASLLRQIVSAERQSQIYRFSSESRAPMAVRRAKGKSTRTVVTTITTSSVVNRMILNAFDFNFRRKTLSI